MANSSIIITQGSGTNVDTRTTTTDGDHRQVVVVGDPATDAGVAPVDATLGLGVDVKGMNGVATTMGNGASGTGVQRVTIASDSTGNIATIGTSVTPGTAAANLGKAEDAAHTTGDVGVLSLGVRRDTAAASSGTDGDYEPFSTDSTGRLRVAALPANSGVDIGDVDVTSVVPGTGATNLGKAEDAAHTTGDAGVMALAIRNDARAAISGTDLDYTPIAVNSAGGVMLHDPAGTAIVYRTAQGTASSAGGAGLNTVVSAESGRSIKVYAYSFTTTAQVGIVPRFTDGSSAAGTTFWRIGAMQAPSQGIAGANLAVTPPAYIFATGASNTLALYLDSASLVHYSVAYFKETA